MINEQTDNGTSKVPVGDPPAGRRTKDNVKDTVVKDGFWTATEICTGAYAQACKEAGIQ